MKFWVRTGAANRNVEGGSSGRGPVDADVVSARRTFLGSVVMLIRTGRWRSKELCRRVVRCRVQWRMSSYGFLFRKGTRFTPICGWRILFECGVFVNDFAWLRTGL